MSFEMQVNLKELLDKVDGIKIEAVVNGGGDMTKVKDSLAGQCHLDNLSFAHWLMCPEIVMSIPGYDGKRGYYVFVDSDNCKITIGFNVGSASPFRAFFTDLCSEHDIHLDVF